jgi:hypothetical protein
MTRSAKTVSIRHLHAAVRTALETAKRAHPDLKLEAVTTIDGSSPLPIYVRFPWFCGLPPGPWPEGGLQDITAFADTFVASLAKDERIASAAPDGNFERSVQIADGNVCVGFVPSDFWLVE